MAIIPADRITLPSITQGNRLRPDTAASATTSFAQVLQSSTHHPEPITSEKAQSVAELMRLEQMRSVIDPFTESSPVMGAATRPASTLLLDALLAQQTPKPTAATTAQHVEATTTVVPDNPPPAAPAPLTNTPEPPQSLQQIISNAAKRYGVDANLIKSVIKVESNYNPNAVSHAGAQGLMQLMPATARGLGVTDPFDPQQNVMAGTRFLKDMLRRYDGNLDAALAAYNWGPGNVDRKGMALPRETRDYLTKVKANYQQFA
jgi:soluble lytic murein transglycosylase-like protein